MGRFWSREEKSLLQIIEKEKKPSELLKKRPEPIWIPSLNSFLKVAGAVFATWFIIHPQYLWKWVLSPVSQLLNGIFYFDKPYSFYDVVISNFDIFFPGVSALQLPSLAIEHNHFQNLIAVHAGVGAVLVGLAFFVAQSLTDKNDPDRGKVLLYKSYFFPLLTAEILVFCLFLWGEVNILSIIPILIIAGLTIFALARVILILLRDYEMEEAKKNLFFKVVRDSFVKILDREITKRIGNNTLFKRYKENKNVEISPFGPINKEAYFPIRASHSGIFADLSFPKLKKLISELEKQREVSKDFDPATTKESFASTAKEPLCYLTPLFYGEIKVGDKILWIRKDLFEHEPEEKKKRFISKIEGLAQEIFDMRDVGNPEEEAKIEFTKLKDRSISAIVEKRTGELEKVIRLYIEIVKEFFNYIELYGGGFSQEQAEKERTSFPIDRLKPVEWLSDDIREIFERGIESRDVNIIRSVAFLPLLLARHAIDRKDHLIFQEFIYFPQLLYSRALKEKDAGNKDLANFMFDRTWRYLKELSDFHLEPKIKDSELGEEEFKGFAIYLLKIFQTLLKSSLDKSDIENFKKFLTASKKLFRHLGDGPYGYRRSTEKNQSRGVFEYLDHKRNQMYFGIASWALHLLERQKSNTVLKDFFDEIKNSLPSKIEDFTKVFIDSHTFEAERFWGWDDWEMREYEEGEVHNIRILEKLEKFYAIRSLSILELKTAEEVSKINLPPNRDLAYLAEGTRDLIRVLDNVAANPADWNFIISNNAANKVSDFKQLLTKARGAQEQKELEEKRDKDISPKKVQEFKDEVVSGFYDAIILRDIFKHYKLLNIQLDKTAEDKKTRFGINIVEDKAAFFEDWHVHFGDWGKNYGRDLASGENSHLLDELAKDCNEVSLSEFETTLSEFDNPADIVIFATNMAFWEFFERSGSFTSKWRRGVKQLDVKGFEGWYEFGGHSVPVFETHHRTITKQILILNKKKLGAIIQLSPLNPGEDKKLVQDMFYMDVQEFRVKPLSKSGLIRRFLFKETTPWLNEHGSKADQMKYLQERVLIHIFERFEYIKPEDFEGYRLTLND